MAHHTANFSVAFFEEKEYLIRNNNNNNSKNDEEENDNKKNETPTTVIRILVPNEDNTDPDCKQISNCNLYIQNLNLLVYFPNTKMEIKAN